MSGSRGRVARPRLVLPELYAILDGDAVRAVGGELLEVARALQRAGVTLLQYRDKQASPVAVLHNAREIAAIFAGSAMLILNDSPEMCVAAGWSGVHVGQGDCPVREARAMVGPDRVIGVSTHTEAQVREAEAGDADYVAIGPVFATGSKRDTEAEVGLGGVARARLLTAKPLVAIGGISAERLGPVLEAGAEACAVIGALLGGGASVEENVRRLQRRS